MLNAVDNALSSFAMALYRSFASPSSATPPSFASRTSHSTALRCAGVSDVHASASAIRATIASYTGRLCPIRRLAATTSGWHSSYAARSASESRTPLRCDTTPHGRESFSERSSRGSISDAYVGEASEDAREACLLEGGRKLGRVSGVRGGG